MRRFILMIALLFGFAAMPFAVHAQQEEDSMDPVADGLSEPQVSPEGAEHSAVGLDTARDARDRGRGFGEDQAEAAQQGGLDFGQGTAGDAGGEPD